MRMTSMAPIGLFVLMLAGPAVAQAPAPGDTGSSLGDQVTRSQPSPTLPAEANRPQERQTEPPKRSDEEFDAPPAGCRYRENKLDLLV